MPKWNTSQAAFSPLNRHTDRKLALFRYEAGVAPSTTWFNVSLNYMVNYTTDTRG
jgi:hypothetical protein